MKIKISLVSLLLAFAMVSFAQEAKTSSDVAGVRTSFMPNKTWDNWFIQLGGGVQTVLDAPGKSIVGQFNDVDFDKLSYPAVNLSIGRWWSPYWGFRIKAQDVGILDKELFDGLEGVPTGNVYENINIHLDAMWNMTQYFCNYNANRVFSFIPYVGLGWMDDKKFESGSISVNAGLLFEFRLSNHFGLHLDLAATTVPTNVFAATAGFTFNLGKSYFEVVEPMDYALVNNLNGKINDLRAENELLSKRPVSCPTCPEAVAVAPVVESVEASDFRSIVLFRIGSAVVDANQSIQIYNTAQFAQNSGEKIKVVGYTDKQTGSAAYNLKLSERRARAVAKELTSKFGIPSDQIIVEWKGDTEQPFPKENAWNRVVIMSAQ